MKRKIPFSSASLMLAGLLALLAVGIAWAGYTGPNRTTTETVRDPDNDVWWCEQGARRCTWQNPANPCPDFGGSSPSVVAQSNCGISPPADRCGCDEAYRESTVSLPPATVGGSFSCAQPGDNGWCRSGASINLSANEPLGGQVIQVIEGDLGVMCDPPDAQTVACSWSGGGEGDFGVDFWAVSSFGDTSSKSSSAWKQDSEPPSASLVISGGEMGGGGWYRAGTVTAGIAGADGTSGVASAWVSLDGGPAQSSVSVSNDGTFSLQGQVVDLAGNSASDSASLRYDGTPPSVSGSLSGSSGKAGWYTSAVTASASAVDNLSGVARVEVRIDGGGWQDSPAVISGDGKHSAEFRAVDVAGNEASGGSDTVAIDGTAPSSFFTSPPDGSEQWVAGEVELAGASTDATSGVARVELSLDGGASWQGLQLSGGSWSLTWDTSRVPNGTYLILARAADIAGNLESSAQVTLRIDNAAPLIDIPDEWELGELAPLTVVDYEVGLKAVEIVVSDGEVPLARLRYLPETVPSVVEWDGRMEDGQAAPPGEYMVSAFAWDRVGNQGSDRGLIRVAQPEPRSLLEALIKPEPPAQEVQVAPRTEVAVVARPEAAPENREDGAVDVASHVWIWPALGWIGLLGMLAYAKLSDPRVDALTNLRQELGDIRRMRS